MLAADAHITMAGTSAGEGCSLKLKGSQRSMEHLTQDDRRDMVEYGRRHLKEEGAMLDMLMAESIWDAILIMVEGEES